jgi:hypothetical protein
MDLRRQTNDSEKANASETSSLISNARLAFLFLESTEFELETVLTTFNDPGV